MKVRQRKPLAVFAETESHQIKITANSLGTLIPVPPHLVRFRVGRVNQADFFAWGQDGILRMAQRKTPSGIIVETECRLVDPRLLGATPLRRGIGQEKVYTDLPANLHPEITTLAHRWADGESFGWPQITAVVQHLRTEYQFDPLAPTPEDCADPLGHFLLHSHCGPDYQFATAAAVLVRALGYPTRLVSGFYAAPAHYDAETRHTPVVPEDVHFWTEVRLPSGEWLVVEPTPGYEVLGPSLPWSGRIMAALLALGGGCGRTAWRWACAWLVSPRPGGRGRNSSTPVPPRSCSSPSAGPGSGVYGGSCGCWSGAAAGPVARAPHRKHPPPGCARSCFHGPILRRLCNG